MCEWNDLWLRLTENQSNYTSSPFMKKFVFPMSRLGQGKFYCTWIQEQTQRSGNWDAFKFADKFCV